MKKQLFVLPLVSAISLSAMCQTAEPVTAIPTAQKSLMQSAKTKIYSRGLYFDSEDAGNILSPLELEYELSADGQSLQMGNVTINEKNFYFSLIPIAKGHSKLSEVLAAEEQNKNILVMKWPEKLSPAPNVEIIGKSGKVLWQLEVDEANKKKWIERQNVWREKLKGLGVADSEINNKGVFGVTYGLSEFGEVDLKWTKIKEPFRFCLSKAVNGSMSRLCSVWYGVRTTNGATVMGKIRMDASEPRVIFGNDAAPMKDSKVVDVNETVRFFAELKSNINYELATKPVRMRLADISDTVKPNVYRVVGIDIRPTNHNVIMNPEQYTKLTKLLGFEDTIGDLRKFWMAAITAQKPHLYFLGEAGGVFKQKFEIKNVPRNMARPYILTNTPKGTYVDGARISVRKNAEVIVSSTENKVDISKPNDQEFTWYFKAGKVGEINKSYLNVEFQGKPYKAFYEMHRGYANELSGRFTGIATSASLLILTEAAYNHWFENLFGWDNYQFSRLRWGVSAKYFYALNKLTVDTAGTKAGLSVLNVDAKYRLTPGIWGREETLGAMLSYQSIQYDKITAPMVGVGAFWARSMPRVFDDFFNIVPQMRYPKFVDMEFIFYPMSMKSTVSLNANFALNFHGKVMWSEAVFGEAGFGMKRYAFSDSVRDQRAELNTFYGTLGLGLNF